jgi:hypothetical protein
MFLLLLAILDVIVTEIGWLPLAVTAGCVTAGVLLAALVDLVRRTSATYGVRMWEIGPSLAPAALGSFVPGTTRETPAVHGVRARRPSPAPQALALVQRFAVLLVVVGTVMALRTALALELLH